MSTRQDYVVAVGSYVKGENLPLGQTEKETAIAEAIKKYSRHKPREIAEDVTGDDGFDYALSDLTYWSEGFSVVRSIEYPVDDTDENQDMLLDEEWEIYRKTSGRVIRFKEDTPDSDETFRVLYTAPHTCTDTACTVDSFDEEAVQRLAAAFFCEMLAAAYAPTNDSMISVDSVDHDGRSKRYLKMADRYKKSYYQHIGIKDDDAVMAASISYDWDKNASWGGDKLTHPRKWR